MLDGVFFLIIFLIHKPPVLIIKPSIKRVVRDKPDDPPATYSDEQSAKACMMGIKVSKTRPSCDGLLISLMVAKENSPWMRIR